jgi:PAS domain S-box-containing protein
MKSELSILLVEDNDGDVRIIKELLKEEPTMSFVVTICSSLDEATKTLSNKSFDTILLDLGLPDSYGFETFTRLNALFPMENAIIILTGLNDTDLGLRAVLQGAQDYIIKGQIDSEKLHKSIIYAFERNRLNRELKKQLEAKKLAEEELVLSREKLNLIATRTSAVMYQLGLNGSKFEYIHQAIEALTGYNHLEINELGFHKLIKKIERVGGENLDLSLLCDLWEKKKVREYSYDYLIETRNRELKWLNDKSYPLYDESGTAMGSIGILMDISSQKEAEIEIVSQNVKSEQLFSNSPIAIVHLDSGGTILQVNSSFEKIFGYNRTEVIGENLDNLIVPYELRTEAANFYKEIIKGLPISEVSMRMRKDKSTLYVSIAGVPIKTNGENIGYYSMYIDLTKQKLAEEALIKSRDKAEESDRLKTAFLHNISHEIRTPMNAIVGFSALLSDQEQPLEVRQSFIDTIVQSSNHLLAIITDIVEISNIETDCVKMFKSDTNINSILNEIHSELKLKAISKNISLSVKPDRDNVSIHLQTDSTKLYQILSNLVNNAIKFTEAGSVEFGYVLINNSIEFFVSDSGIGIAPEHQTSIFERFYQVESSEDRQYEGTGLGLAISKAYVELLGGTIKVTSTIGTGSKFIFSLPMEKGTEKTIEAKPASITDQNLSAEGKTILIAEDIESNFKLIRFFLSSLNAEIFWARNGKDAVDYFKSHPETDLILMDIKMPVMDGYEAIQQIRVLNLKVPIIAQTAFAEDRTKITGSGCNGFISKPFNKNQLISTIREYLQ